MQMTNMIGVILIVFTAFISAVSQVLLKKSANIGYSNKYREYINLRVITAYGILFLTIVINMYALRFISFKLSNIVGTMSYVFVIVLSQVVFDEHISMKKYLGIAIIIFGIIVFNL